MSLLSATINFVLGKAVKAPTEVHGKNYITLCTVRLHVLVPVLEKKMGMEALGLRLLKCSQPGTAHIPSTGLAEDRRRGKGPTTKVCFQVLENYTD